MSVFVRVNSVCVEVREVLTTKARSITCEINWDEDTKSNKNFLLHAKVKKIRQTREVLTADKQVKYVPKSRKESLCHCSNIGVP